MTDLEKVLSAPGGRTHIRRSRIVAAIARVGLAAKTLLAGAVIVLLTLAAPAAAQVAPFTDPPAFEAAVPGGSTVETVDFEAVPAGTVLPSGAVLEGVTWTHSIAGGAIDLAVGSGLPTTSRRPPEQR